MHHRDHDHDNNPPDGSNWELLCVYCHDNEHSRELEAAARETPEHEGAAHRTTHRPFADLAKLLKGGGDARWSLMPMCASARARSTRGPT